MRHALDKIRERLTPAEQQTCVRLLGELPERVPEGSAAVVLMRVEHRGTPWGEESNGDLVVAIVRDGRVVTVFLRRSSQPLVRESFDVDRVLVLCEV